MKILTLILLISPFILWSQNIGIGTDSPHASAKLEIQSTTGGVLIPRLTSSERDAIPQPLAVGLLIFNSSNNRFEFWDGSSWMPIASAAGSTEIVDGDNDTKITVEEFIDEDTIRFEVNGDHIAKLDNQTFHLESESHGTFVGLNAGRLVPNSDSWNTFIGHRSGEKTSTGISNTFVGAYSGSDGNKGNSNVFLGILSGEENSGSNNTFLGTQAGQKSTFGNNNTYVGINAGGQNTGSDNIAVGNFTMHFGGGNNNIAIGKHSMITLGGSRNNLIGIGDSTLTKNGQNATFPFQGLSNTAIGSKSLKLNRTGSGNTALGFLSLEKNDNGSNNTGLGSNSLSNNTSGYNNTAVGTVGLQNNSSGVSNTSLGYSAGRSNQTGSNNTFIGSNSGDNANGNGSTFVGANSGFINSTGEDNTYIGYDSGKTNTTGSRNTAVGKNSGGSGNSNTFIGVTSGNSASGQYSVGIGDSTLIKDEGYGNLAIGPKAGLNNRLGERNIYVGDSSGFNHANGDENIFIGYKSGGNVSGSVGAIAIGTRSGMTASNESISIGYEANRWGASRNISIGKQAGFNGTAQNSIYLGNYMGYDNAEDHRLFIGNLSYGTLIYGEMENRTVEVKNNLITGTARLRAPVDDARLFMKSKTGVEGRILVKQENTENLFIGDIDNTANDVIFRSGGLDRMFLNGNGNLGLGHSATSDRLTVDADEDQVPMNIKYRGISKLMVHDNGGISIGSGALPPMDGLLVQDLANTGDHPLRVNDAGIIYKDELNKYKSFSPPALFNNPLSGGSNNNSPSFKIIIEDDFIWADLDLPHNSKAKTFKIYFRLGDTETIRVEIFKKPINNGTSPIELANFGVLGAGNLNTATGSIVLNETIDNQNYSYYFRVWNESTSEVAWVFGITQSFQE